MFDNVLVEQNPHWSNDLYEDGIQRSCFYKLLQLMDTQMIVSIMGVRRAGKSTLIKQLINHLITKEKIAAQNILFLNLEHPYFSQYASDVKYLEKIFDNYLKIAMPKGKIYCMLDEVQFFQNWQVFVKAHFESKKIKFVITGSNSALLSSDLMTLLSGRALPLQVYPLSFQEVAHYHRIDSSDSIHLAKHRHKLHNLLDDYIRFGGFPEVVSTENKAVVFDILNAYAKSILYQDVVPRLQTRHPAELEKLFVYLISNIGKPFSYHKLSELFSLSDKSIKKYIKAYSDSYLLFELDMFSYSLKKQIRNPKKVYSIDTGEVNATSFAFTENTGRLFENFVFLELKRLGLELFYYKTENGLEVDFVAKEKSRYALIQTAWNMSSKETRERELKALVLAMKETKLSQGFIITREDEETIHIDDIVIHVVCAYKLFCQTHEKIRELLFS